jgi:hypothetical protein
MHVPKHMKVIEQPPVIRIALNFIKTSMNKTLRKKNGGFFFVF